MTLKPEVFRSELTGDEYHLFHHPSGLDVLTMPMPGFTTTEAIFATKYGSVINRFKTLDTGDFITVPDGIAHYLEHKLFENEDCEVFELYAKTGAMANAFTSFDLTGYTFSVASDYREPLRILLDFVQKPYFTDENVEKERGIIAQEIKMSADSPSRAIFFRMLECLYHVHPVKTDIAGTVESIQEITTDLLYKCYNTFYNLNNMVLSIAGNIDDETVLSICDECLRPSENRELEFDIPAEPADVVRKRSSMIMPVGVPLFMLGFKCDPLVGTELQKTSIAVELMLRIQFGSMSPWYKKALEEGIINMSFGFEVFSSDLGYFSILFSGESDRPDELYESLVKEIEDCKTKPVDAELFAILQKEKYGTEVFKYNQVTNCTETMCFHYIQGLNCFDSFKFMAELTVDDIENAKRLLDLDRSSFCTLSSK